MEHGLDSAVSNVRESDCMKNGVVSPIMANFPDGPVTQSKENKKPNELVKVNGEGTQDYDDIQDNPFEDSYSSESDALVIDESVPKKKRGKYKKSKEIVKCVSEKQNDNDLSNHSDQNDKLISETKPHTEPTKDIFSNDSVAYQPVQTNEIQNFPANIFSENTQTSDNFSASSDILEQRVSETPTHYDVTRLDSDISNNTELLSHTNPFFHESLFELSQLHHTNNEHVCSEPQTATEISTSVNRTLKRTKPKPKLKEYAQYLGLQPAVQFKCPKCGKSGFESLLTLQEHFLQCNAIQTLEKASNNENVSGFKLTRKVFLCSACGTYYENWNLYMHMLEYHKRYICLYCLGMFSVLNDLCQHIQSRHNLEPGIKNTLEDFYNTYNEPCYVVCCECNQQFNEGDNFFYHNCISTKPVAKSKPKHIKQVIAPENHITGDFGALPNEITHNSPLDRNNILEENREESTLEKMVNSKKVDMVDNLENHSEEIPQTIENIPESESITNQGNNDKQNCDDRELPKNSDSDSTECEDDLHSSGSTLDTANYKTVNDLTETKLNENLEKKVNGEDIEETCDIDSLDSSKMSELNQEDQHPTESTMDDIEENLSDCGESIETPDVCLNEPIETRKVPKLSLKLPKPGSYPEPEPEDSDDSDKVDMEVDNIESENEHVFSEPGEDTGMYCSFLYPFKIIIFKTINKLISSY